MELIDALESLPQMTMLQYKVVLWIIVVGCAMPLIKWFRNGSM